MASLLIPYRRKTLEFQQINAKEFINYNIYVNFFPYLIVQYVTRNRQRILKHFPFLEIMDSIYKRIGHHMLYNLLENLWFFKK